MEKRQKLSIYFGSNGITATSANYVANVAKELIRKEQSDIDNVDFVTCEMCTADTQSTHITKKGDDENKLASLPEKLERVAKMKQLIAWLREAIKAKDELLKEAETLDREEVLEKINYERVADKKQLREYSEKEFIATLPEKEQERILLLNTKAAIYGKFVHENGTLGKARQKAFECDHTPAEVQRGLGGVTIVESRASVPTEQIDKVYFDLQKEYREVQKELNAIMFKVQDEMRKENLNIREYNLAVVKDNFVNTKAENTAVNKWRKKECKRIGEMKIVIPPTLQALYEEVNSL